MSISSGTVGRQAGAAEIIAAMGEIAFTTTLAKRGPAAAAVLDDEQVATVREGATRFPVRAPSPATPGAAASSG